MVQLPASQSLSNYTKLLHVSNGNRLQAAFQSSLVWGHGMPLDLNWLVSIDNYIPHGYCLSWSPQLIAINVISDLLIFASYFSIPVALTYFAYRRTDFTHRWLLWLFSAFILTCGLTHLMGAVVLWQPWYGVDAMLKMITAVMSVATAVAIWPLIPKALGIPNPLHLERINRLLEDEIVQRQRVEAELREEKQKNFSVLFNAADDGIFLLGMDGEIIEINAIAHKRLGYAKDEMIGKPIRDFDSAEFAAGVGDRINQINQNGHAVFESAHRCKDGTIVPVEINSKLIHLDGQPRILSIIRDITERKRAEQSLRESKTNLRCIMDNLPYMAWLKDTEGRYIAVNSVYANAAGGGNAANIIGKTDWDIHPKELAEKYRTDDATVMTLRRPLHIEEEAVYHGQNPIWAETFKTPVIDPLGKLLGTVGCALDITARKRMENTLREHQKLLDLFIEHAPVGLAMFDRQMHYIAVSNRWLNNYGKTKAELIGRSHYKIMPEIPERLKDAHRRGLAGEVVRGKEECIVRKRNQLSWVHWEVHPWYTGEGTVGGIIILSEDITEIKLAEEKRRIDEREIQLHKLNAAATVAQEQERQSIAAKLHDEIGQILNVLRLKVETLTNGLPTDSAARNVAENMTGLLTDVIASVRDLTTKLSPPMLKELGLIPSLSGLADEMMRHYQLPVEVNSDKTAIVIDFITTAVLFRVVRELVINVAKHAQATKAQIHVANHRGHLRIVVSDDGVGMSEWQSLILQKRSYGLASIHERINALNGTMDIQSPPGCGTIVTLTVPFAPLAPLAPQVTP